MKRCISGLPTGECPRIAKTYLERYQLIKRTSRSIPDSLADDEPMADFPAVPAIFDPQQRHRRQVAVQESTIQCEERRKLGQQILIEKVQKVDSMLSRFVGNFISHFSNSTNSQEVIIHTLTPISHYFFIFIFF